MQAAAAAAYARSGGAALPAGSASPWDTDAYGRPLKLISADGSVLPRTGEVHADTHTHR